jgi:putative transposase
MSKKYEITDYQWQQIEPFIPKKPSTCGRDPRNPRELVNAILWVLRTGAPWCEIPKEYGPWKTAYNNFRRWEAKGVMEKIFQAVAPEALTINEAQIDSTSVHAHQHAAGAKKGLMVRAPRRKVWDAPEED